MMGNLFKNFQTNPIGMKIVTDFMQSVLKYTKNSTDLTTRPYALKIFLEMVKNGLINSDAAGDLLKLAQKLAAVINHAVW